MQHIAVTVDLFKKLRHTVMVDRRRRRRLIVPQSAFLLMLLYERYDDVNASHFTPAHLVSDCVVSCALGAARSNLLCRVPL